MKNTSKFLGFIVFVVIAGLIIASCSDPASNDSPPVLSGTVSITGTAQVGQTLTANTANLGGSGTISYQWKRGNTNIGTNSSTYIVQSADLGYTITVTVTRSGYSGSVSSTATVTVTDSGLPALSGTVSITGDAIVGQMLTANTGSLGGSGTISYQWKRGTANIGTNSGTYTVQAVDVGYTIIVTVTRSGNSGSVSSDPTAIVALTGLTGNDAADFGASAKIDNTFNVGTFAEWNDALSAITSGGNNKNYIINIIADFYITTGRSSNNFGDVSGVKVSVRGVGKTLTLTSSGSIVRVGNEQTVILRDVTLRGYGSNSSPIIYVTSGGTYTMQSGKITDNTASSVSGVYVAVAATFNMNGGEISGNTGSSTSNGSIVGVYQYANFNMNGGKISSNTSNSTSGGVVLISEGTFTMQGGEISGNTGRGVYFNSNETLTMQNGKISNNTGANNGGGVYLNSGTLTMSDSEISGNSGTGVSVALNGTFTMNGGEISGNNGRGVYFDSNETLTITNGKISNNTGSNGTGVWLYRGTFTMRDSEISGNSSNGVSVYSGTFTMYDSEISGNNWQGVEVGGGGTFNMQGGEIARNTIYGIYSHSGTSMIANGIIYGSNEADMSLSNGSALGSGTIQYGTFSGNTWNSNGTIHPTSYTVRIVNGVPYIGSSLANNYTFNVAATNDWDNALNAIDTYDNFSYTINVMADFDIASTASFGNASGITVTLQGVGKTLTLSSNGNLLRIGSNQTVILGDLTLRGRVSNNDSLVYVNGGSFTMNSGKISGNTANGSNSGGGGVYVASRGTFIMSGGEISGNTINGSYSRGGGVYVASSGTFTMSGGEISGNTANGSNSGGGGVLVASSGTFTMSGGEISGNSASGSSSSGGGVWVYIDGGFTKTGGTITGYDNDIVNGNIVKNGSGVVQNNQGHAVYNTSTKRRESTAGSGVNMDSSVAGAAGGWEE